MLNSTNTIPILGPCTCTVCTVQYTMCHMHRCNVQWSTHKAWPHPQLDFGLWCTIHSELCACPQPWLMLVHFGHRRVHFMFFHVYCAAVQWSTNSVVSTGPVWASSWARLANVGLLASLSLGCTDALYFNARFTLWCSIGVLSSLLMQRWCTV